MYQCPKCDNLMNGKESAPPQICEKCGLVLAKFGRTGRGRKRRKKRQWWDVKIPIPSWATVRVVAVVVFCCTFGLLLKNVRKPNPGAGRTIAGITPITSLFRHDPCREKPKCVTLFVAPWCPTCEKTLAALPALLERWNSPQSRSEYGLRVVAGEDAFDKCSSLAVRLGDFAAADSAGSPHFRALEIKAYPTWVVSSQDGQEIFRLAGGIADASAINEFVAKALHIEE